MNPQTEIGPHAPLSDYLAAERTLLAWIRTGLALMGFGFVVARFGLFLQELQVAQNAPPTQSFGLSLWFGIALIAVGVFVHAFAGWHHLRLIAQLDRGDHAYSHPSSFAVTIAIFLAIVGLAMAIYLVSFRSLLHPNSATGKETSMASPTEIPATKNGIVTRPSNRSVDETVQKLKTILQSKGVTLFALIDHSGEAEKAGLKMPPTKLLIFGSPATGTPVMQAAPSIALDLPLKILVAEDEKGKVWLSYNSPAYLLQRHAVPQNLLKNISAVEQLAAAAAG